MGCSCAGIEDLETGSYDVLRAKIMEKLDKKIRHKLASTDPFYAKVADEIGFNVTDETLDGQILCPDNNVKLIAQKDGRSLNFCLWCFENGGVYEGSFSGKQFAGFGRYMKIEDGQLVMIQGVFSGKKVKSKGIISIGDDIITG